LKPLKPLLILSVALLLLSTTLVLPEVKEEKKQKPKKSWSLAVKGGITLNAGNTESQLINGGVKFGFKKKGIEFLTNFEAFYGSGAEEQTVNKGKWFNKFVNKTEKHFNLYGTFSLEYDIFAKIALRGNSGVGIQYSFADTPKTKVKLASGINGEFTNGLDEIESTKSLRFNLQYTQERTFSDTAKYSIELLYTSNFGHFFSDYRIEAGVSLSVALKNPLSLKIEMQERYTNHPLEENLLKNDFLLVTSLEISL
jgi:putative salt-induced outer membrane protein YdiY